MKKLTDNKNKEKANDNSPQEKKPAADKPQEIKVETLKTKEAKSAVDSKKITELEEKLKTAEDKYLRLYAEFENFRKRTEAEKTEHAKYAAGQFVEAVLPVLDSFERSQKTLTEADAEVRNGFELIRKQLEDVLQKFGVQRMESVGKIFDPRFHEALLQQESDQPAQTVLEEYLAGYLMHDKVLRHAQVVVAK